MDRFWRNRLAVVGAVLVAAMLAVALAAPWLAPADPTVANLEEIMQPASRAHPLGTDELGRDLSSRIVWGARTSMLIGAVVLVIALVAGTVVGFAAGWWGGLIDDVLMRAVDVLMTFPSILLAMAIVAALGPGLVNVMIAVGVSAVPRFARIGRAVLLSLRHEVFVEAACGARRGRPAHRRPPHPAEHPRAARRAVEPALCHGHPERGRPRLPRTGRPAADGGVGRHARRTAAFTCAWPRCWSPPPAWPS